MLIKIIVIIPTLCEVRRPFLRKLLVLLSTQNNFSLMLLEKKHASLSLKK